MEIPFLSFDYMHNLLRQEAIDVFTQFYDDKYYILGKGLEQFEADYAAFSTTKYAAGTSNGLDAIYIALKTLGIGPGDEVIVPSNTFIATVLAVSYTGATPVFAEPDKETYNITATTVLSVLTKATKAIIPVHLYGQACEMDDIMRLAAAHKLFVVEDNAQAHSATYNDKITGCFGHINATSFYPGKNLGALGDAGAVTTDVEDYIIKARMLRNYGSRQKYSHEIIGHNMRLDEIQARFLSLKLNYLQQFTQQRIQAAGWYNTALDSCGSIITPVVASGATHVYHLYVIRTQQRDKLQQHLQQAGISTLIHYPVPPHLQLAYKHLGYKETDFPVAEELAKTSLSLPLYPGITKEQVEYVCDSIRNFFNK
ncbi:MAG TPA: DegT/DnrJ/EryC1/StrS family aminotransferase [Chitinophagaceae bacterium]|nr:DegT/DnrJ/EryC1/StrS family aminotransferase [Chitinophagaceae bacterium]